MSLMMKVSVLLSLLVVVIFSQDNSKNTKFFLPSSGNGPDLLSGAAGFGLGLAASQIGGNLINGIGNGGGGCCCGRKKRQANGKDTKLFGLGHGNNCANCPNCGGGGYTGGYTGGSSSCRCTSLTFYNNGHTHGNCRSRDETGRVWCYTTGWNSGCGDLHSSSRFPNNPWSYNACPNNNNYGK